MSERFITDGIDVTDCCALDNKYRCEGKNLCAAEYCAFKYELLLDKIELLEQENAQLKSRLEKE